MALSSPVFGIGKHCFHRGPVSEISRKRYPASSSPGKVEAKTLAIAWTRQLDSKVQMEHDVLAVLADQGVICSSLMG